MGLNNKFMTTIYRKNDKGEIESVTTIEKVEVVELSNFDKEIVQIQEQIVQHKEKKNDIMKEFDKETLEFQVRIQEIEQQKADLISQVPDAIKP